MSGFIAWQGPSPVTGDPLVLVITGPSDNQKTGPMYQAWLLLRNVDPFEAIRRGLDRAICGTCVHRSVEKRSCYVQMFKGPAQIWRGVTNGIYPVLDAAEVRRRLTGRQLRITAYGDPAFVPLPIWESMLEVLSGWVGYTHQWTRCDPAFRAFLMASVETTAEARAAHARGWRTFRARPHGAPVEADEFQCPASEEAGHRSTCLRCQLCRGTASPAKSVSILLHGQRAAPRRYQPRAKYDELRQELTATGYSVQSVASPRHNTILLALRQFFLRRQSDSTVSVKRLRKDLYLFWRREAS